MCTRYLGRDWICSERLRLLILKYGPDAVLHGDFVLERAPLLSRTF
jgi:hypothetical protein